MYESSRPVLPFLTALATRRRFIGIAAILAVSSPRATGAQGTPAPSVSPVALPDTPVGHQLAWVLEVINSGAGELTAGEVQEHFSPDFLTAVPAAQMVSSTQAIAGQLAPLRFVRFEGESTETEAIAYVESDTAGAFNLSIAVNPEPPHLIVGLLIEPATATPATPVVAPSWENLDRQLGALAPTVEVTAAELVDAQLQPIHALKSAAPIAIGSVFKLYVLGELGRQIAAGEAAWDEPLAIRDEWKSLPSGGMHDLPAGTEFPLRHYAEQMISVSDNTAADHLLFRLGREQVEAIQTPMGNTHAERNVPFISAREQFVLKLALPPERVEAYIAASSDEKRRLLAEEIDPTPVTLEQAESWTEPRYIDTLEWFASGEDLCRAMAALHSMSMQPELAPLRDVLAINPGIELDSATWPYIGFKGGSEVGVLTVSWLLQRADGRWFTLNLGLNNTEQAIDIGDETLAISLAEQALTLLGTTS